MLDFHLNVSRKGAVITSECAEPDLLHQDVRKVIWRRILDTEDRAVREKLIELGWTPPSRQRDGWDG